MSGHQFSPTRPECLPDYPPYVNFERKRAGRAVVESYQVRGVGDILGVFKVVIVAIGEGRASETHWAIPTWRELTAPHVVGLIAPAKVPVIDTPIDEDEEDASEQLANWFANHQAAAERSLKDSTSARLDEEQDEVILARRGGLRSRAWRGGGTMRRR